MSKFICIESKEYYTTTTDGSQVVINCDVQAEISDGLIEDMEFSKCSLTVYPDTDHWIELGVPTWEDFKKYIPAVLLEKIRERAGEDLSEQYHEEIAQDQADAQSYHYNRDE